MGMSADGLVGGGAGVRVFLRVATGFTFLTLGGVFFVAGAFFVEEGGVAAGAWKSPATHSSTLTAVIRLRGLEIVIKTKLIVYLAARYRWE
jgi:hypothetical protein